MKRASSVHGACGARRTFLWLWVGNLFTIISLYLRHRGMDSTACSCSREAARKIGLPLQGAQTAFVLCSRIPPDHNPPYPPLVSALRLVCCLRIQIWLSLSLCYACSHRVFTLGAPCMGLLGPCRLKSFLRQSIYYHIYCRQLGFRHGSVEFDSNSKSSTLYCRQDSTAYW